MFPAELAESNIFSYVILPLLIFFMRITDVSIGTIRIIFVSRGNRIVAPILGFFEVFVWIIAISNILLHLDNWICYVAYAGGFATGNYVGMLIEEKLAIGVSLIRVIAKKEVTGLSEALQLKGYGTTTIDAHGKDNDVNMIYTIVKRKNLEDIIYLIKKYNPSAFYTIEDIRYVSHDNFPINPLERGYKRFYLFNGWRKGK
jgi:uncharacterized protein YebE (UPF0316 family)